MRGGTTTTPMVVTRKCSIGENQELWFNRKNSKFLVAVYKRQLNFIVNGENLQFSKILCKIKVLPMLFYVHVINNFIFTCVWTLSNLCTLDSFKIDYEIIIIIIYSFIYLFKVKMY